MTRKRRSVASVMLALVMLTSACGGDDDDEAKPKSKEETTTTTEAETTSTSASSTTTGPAVDPASVKTDFGADATSIRIGLLADLSGPFAALVKDIVLAQQVYWDGVNANGGIAGRKIVLDVQDTMYVVPTHRQLFQAMKARDTKTGVLILSQSTGSPHTASIRTELEAENLLAIPLSWYSGWPDPAYGKNVFEAYTNYCFEAINAVQYMHDKHAVKKMAVVSFPGEYGQDGAKGAKLAAEKLGIQIVYDGEGKVIAPTPNSQSPDNSGVVAGIAGSGADLVWATINPGTLATLMSQAASKGFKGKWAGSSPSYTDSLLTGDVAPLITSSYYQSTYTVALGTDVPGMAEMVAAIKKGKPDARASDAYVYGWTEAEITDAVLRKAAAAGDMTRAGVVKAGFELDKVDFKGLAPAQTWKGDANSYVVRESYMFKPKSSLYKAGAIGVGNTGSELLQGPFASDITKNFQYTGACFKPAA